MNSTKSNKKDFVPIYKKYSKSTSISWLDPSTRLKPSDLAKPSLDVIADDYPLIIEFNNMKDNTSQIHSTVDIDQPLFYPSPKVVVFDDYAPFTVHEKKLFFRNNDSVARRIKIIQPDGPFFEISAPKKSNGELLKQSKIAAGMEICYIVKFKPQEVRDYSHELLCSTEREKFIVPIRAVGMRPRLTLPDEVRFGNCPIKTPTRETLLVQNIGTSVARFSMRCTNTHFSCPGEELTVDPGSSRMIELFFTPINSQASTGDLVVEFSKGVTCYIELFGSGSNVDVSLSTSSVALEPAYISLSSQKTIRIKNMSDLPIKFSWKSFANESEEDAERARLLSEISRMETLEMAQLKQRILSGYYGPLGGAQRSTLSLSEAGEDEGEDIPFSALADEASLSRKYRHLRKALENDPLQFVDDIFDISPVEGQVWANSYKEITLSFRPDTAALYNCVGYLDISGRQDRLALHLSGQGIGPLAALSFDVLDVGDVFTNDEQTYSLSITNKGDILAQWAFMSSLTKFGSKFRFSPTEGSLLPGQTQFMTILFESEILGEFSEYFRFALQGNEDMLVCQIKGHVIGPTFHFDCNSIDFGKVSFDYLHTTSIRLVNTSKVSMLYKLHIPQDDNYGKKEFNLEPNQGLLRPGEGCDILVEFIPCSVKVYDYSLTVDILGIGDMLLSIPVKAECIVSTVSLESKEIDFGDCFLRYPYTRRILLSNLSDSVRTKFEILPQSQMAKVVASFEADPSVAVIEPSGTCVVTLTLITEKLGKYRIPIQIAISGSQEPPIQAGINYSTIGPRVILNSSEIRWGPIECLKDSSRSLRLLNDSLIPATLKFFLKTARSKFDVNIRELVMKAHEEVEVDVTANLDDSIVVKDELHVMVEDGESLMIPLSAKGIGTTMYCKDNLSVLDMGVQLTGVVFERKVVLENKGRRPQQLHWVNKTIDEENKTRANNAKKLGKDLLSKIPKNLTPLEAVFTVIPEEITLRPRTGTTFTFKGMCLNPGPIEEHFVLESRVGKERVMREIIQTDVKCEIVNPLLEFSSSEISFSYSWSKTNEPSIQHQMVVLKNASPLPLTFVLRTDVPFNLSSWEHTLNPEESVEVTVEFDPGYMDNRQSHCLEKQLSISYRGHSQKDVIPLKCEINFPNLSFEVSTINFGCILNDTSKIVKMKTTNISKMEAAFEWLLMEQKVASQGSKSRTSLLTSTSPLNHIVDILPIRAVLEPGESQDIEFSMFGGSNSKLNGFAICMVEGGPEYKIPLTGESSTVSFTLDRQIIDFGKILISEKHDQEVNVTNNGKVVFNIEIKPRNPTTKEVIELFPISAKVQPGQSQKITIRLRPGLPINECEILLLNIAHFEPVSLHCYYQGIFPSAVANLPRYRRIGPFGQSGEGVDLTEEWAHFISEATRNCLSPELSKIPPPLDFVPPPVSETSAIAPTYVDPDSDPLSTLYLDSNLLVVPSSSTIRTKSNPANAKQTQQLALEKEMQRIVFATILQQQVAALDDRDGEGPILGLQSTINKFINIESIVIASYVVEFGNVIIGQTRKRVFKISNASILGPLNWGFDKNLILGSGYSVEPERVQKLPEQATVDVTIKYFARLQQKLGRKALTLPLECKGCPRINLVLTANVCLPEIEISSEIIEMGKVLIGRSRKSCICFHNTSPVTANWSLKRITGKDEMKINIQPQEGSLRAGKKEVLTIEFMPSEARKYHLEVLLKIDNNAKPKTLIVNGDGIGSPIRFDPQHLDLGPVIPFTEGDERTVSVSNLSDFPVEIFSLDFDEVYKKEDEIVSALDIFDADGLYRASIREAGELLPQEILKLYDKLTFPPPPEAEVVVQEAPIGFTLPLEMPSIRTPNQLAPRDAVPPLHQDILIIGPPVSGVSTLANYLGKKLQLIVKTVDEILKEVAMSKSPQGEFCRRLLGVSTPTEKKDFELRMSQMQAAAENSKVQAVEAFKKANKKAKEIPPEVYHTPEADAFEAFLLSEQLNEESLVEIFQHRISWEDTGYGIVFDGASSNIIEDTSLIISALKTVLPRLIVAHISFPGDHKTYSQRLAGMLKQKKEDLSSIRSSIKSYQDIQAKLRGVPLPPKPKPKAASSATPSLSSPTLQDQLSPRRSPRQENLMSTEDLLQQIPMVLPAGDEPWVDQETGMVIELDNQDFKALEENQKAPYIRQLLSQLLTRLEGTIVAVQKLSSIFDESTGRFLGPPIPEDEEEESLSTSVHSPRESASISSENNSPRLGEKEPLQIIEIEKEKGSPKHESASPIPSPHSPRSLAFQNEEDNGFEGDNSDPNQPPLTWRKLIAPRVTSLYQDYMRFVLPSLSLFQTAEEFLEQKPEHEADAESLAGGGGSVRSHQSQQQLQHQHHHQHHQLERELGLFEIGLVDGDENEQAIINLASALLPPPKVNPSEKNLLPPPLTYQILKKTVVRPDRKPIRLYQIFKIPPPKTAEQLKAEEEAANLLLVTDKLKRGKGAVVVSRPTTSPSLDPQQSAQDSNKYRWVIPPNSSVEFKVRFRSANEGKFDCSLGFEVVGTRQVYSLYCSGTCEVPRVNTDTRNIFMKRIRALNPGAPPPQRRFAIADNTYSFGPLLRFKRPEWRLHNSSPTDSPEFKLWQIIQTNTDVLRISNNGKYRCQVVVNFEDLDPESKGVFSAEPTQFEVDEGDTKEIKIWAFPPSTREYSNRIIVCIQDNPQPLVFPLLCYGVDPSLEVTGPWTESLRELEELMSKTTDKKQIKDLEARLAALREALLLDFNRILVGKADNRNFEVKNTSLLPVAWTIDRGDFADSSTISFLPSSGILPPNGSTCVAVSFTSPTPLMLSGRFSMRFSDAEGGLDAGGARVNARHFKIVAEAYDIRAVSLTSEGQEERGNEIDFGLIRVGDTATQTLQMGNRGKYRISYKLIVTKPALAQLLTIEPSEGVIEPGPKLEEIKISFCTTGGELTLKNNKDVLVLISEPLTGEQVEKFPLFLNTIVKYNRLRVQPSKGTQFGAIRFDSEKKTKRVEIRNEGSFSFAYVICLGMSEHDELDTLDPGAFGVYAYHTPAAIRRTELGDKYLERIPKGDGKKKGAGRSGKGGSKGSRPNTSSSDGSNPLVQDPDNLTLGPIPDDPLVLGAFSIYPRVGVVEPGQSVGIDMTFSPSGSEVFRETLRFCVSGSDPNDSLIRTIRNFDLTAESCFPAIETDEAHSIFEEQEVVSMLSDVGGKLERLPVGKVVYAEAERMLAFGPVICNQTGGKGVFERIRISNPTKIDVKVALKVTSMNEEAPTNTVDKMPKPTKKPGLGRVSMTSSSEIIQETLVFSVQPESIEIPPHEHRFVNIYFSPTEIKSYRGLFRAEVVYDRVESVTQVGLKAAPTQKPATKDKDDASLPPGKVLSFSLGGTGTLPCIAVDYPVERLPTGNIPMEFPRTHIQRTSQKKLVIRNDGSLPAICLFEMNGDDDFDFPLRGSSLTVPPGQKEEIFIRFMPQKVVGNGIRNSLLKISVLHNPYDIYTVQLSGESFACDLVIETTIPEDDQPASSPDPSQASSVKENSNQDEFQMKDVNLSEGAGSSLHRLLLRSRAPYPLTFDLTSSDPSLSFEPYRGHLGPNLSREILVTFHAETPTKLENHPIQCQVRKIEYTLPATSSPPTFGSESSLALQGQWDTSMKSLRPCLPSDLEAITASEIAWKEYKKAKDAFDKLKASKKTPTKPLGPMPPPCLLQLGPTNENGEQMIFEILPEPTYTNSEEYAEQSVVVKCSATADVAKFVCEGDGENISFRPTFMFQSSQHRFKMRNECGIRIPVKWSFEDLKRRAATRGGVPRSRASTSLSTAPTQCPFLIEPEEAEIAPNSEMEFFLRFQPLDTQEYVFSLKGETITAVLEQPPPRPSLTTSTTTATAATTTTTTTKPNANPPPEPHELELRGPVRMVVRGTAKRPICHFEIEETRDYLSRRAPNLKNENGLYSPIEDSEIRVVEVSSVGLRTRNTFRFHIINPTNDNYEFMWETIGDSSSFWRCLQTSGVLFAGKRIEISFEFLPEEISTAEAFFKFRLPSVGLEQNFLFAGQVKEPKVFFSTSRVDFHSVMLGGEGLTEVVYLENEELTPFNFVFEKSSLAQLEGVSGPILEIDPKTGVVPPHSRFPISFSFHPQEEIIYNFNVGCEVKRKPNKLSINFKGEGYAVHPFIQLEQPEDSLVSSFGSTRIGMAPSGGVRYQTLRPHPFVNYADFGVVQVLDSLSKSFTVANQGKYNFDYVWDTNLAGPMITLSGGKMGGTLHKGEEVTFKLTFAPQSVASLDGASLSFTVAGKYTYNILARGTAVEPALRFSFLQYDFGPCFVTSPGGNTVTEEVLLRLVNHDMSNNISVECGFQKMRALWVECPPTVLGPGNVLDVTISFAPREVKDYTFIVPFIVNGTTKVPVKIAGRGCTARLELLNQSQRRLNFGVINVGSESRKIVPIVNRSKKALPVQLIENGDFSTSLLEDKCVSFSPRSEFVISPRDTVNLQISFSPTRRIPSFSEDLMIRFAGVTRKLLTMSGKAQGPEASLDTDSLPFGVVVIDSMKTKKISLENTGDLTLTYQWLEGSFGRHFSISPLNGKLNPGSEQTFEVTFRPKFADEDIRQDGITLVIPGMYNLTLTCTGSCILQPAENVKVLQFTSLTRKEEVKSVQISNPSDKDWHLAPILSGEDWKAPHEFKVPARSSANLPITYFPLSMSNLAGITNFNSLFAPPTIPDPKTRNKQPVETDPFEAVPLDRQHQGQLFLALPDGNALLYSLRGLAGPPECSGTVTIETPAKKPAVAIVKLVNWLGRTQKFLVEIEMLTQASPATSLIVANAVEIGPNGTKEFPIRFLSFVEGVSSARITFKNPSSGEYLFYELTGRTTMSEVLETINIDSPVRQTARHPITIENPLKGPAVVSLGSLSKPEEWWTCGAGDVRVNLLTPFTGNSEATFEVEYRPLKSTAQPQEHLLTIISQELGVFKYKLVLTASPPPLKHSLRFEVPLGSAHSETFLFRTYNTSKCEFTCSVKKPEFFTIPSIFPVDACPSGWDGDEVRISITFEPTEIGDVRDTLVLRNADWGEYECELLAACVAPMPQGPFNLLQGAGSVEIPFRNCFLTASNWTFSVDSPAFRLITSSLQVPAKSQGKCVVSFEPPPELMSAPGGFITAKLFVACASKPSVAPWVFYLRGKIDQNSPNPSGSKGNKK